MEARDRTLPQWFERIRSRQLSLPRFQRNVAWGHNEVAGLLTTVLRELPSGAALILEVGDELPFISRPMKDAPQEGERVTELLLDGQQRLTALWRSLHDHYPDRTYLVYFEDDPHKPGKELPSVYGRSRYMRDDQRFPLWVDDPSECWRRGYIPLRLMKPGDNNDEIDQWIEGVAGDDHNKFRELDRRVQSLRSRISAFNLPFLSLPVSTPREVALEVFIKMNTSSVRLSTFDIIVAQVESEADESLHDLVAKLEAAAPHAKEYKSPEDLILDVAALMQDRAPNQAGYAMLDLPKLVDTWPELVSNIASMVEFLESQKVFDGARLPTDPILAVIAALFSFMPDQPDEKGNFRRLLRKYLWRSFFTTRYDRAAATAAFNDFRAIRDVICKTKDESSITLFNDDEYPIVSVEEIRTAGWPKNRNTLGRGILALAILMGARDIADDTPASRAHLKQREYHHLFPRSLLESVGMDKDKVFRSLNCALITWRTNRTISNKDPLDYLRERSEANSLGESEIRRRLDSHIIDYDALSAGEWNDLDDESRSKKINETYDQFLEQRAESVHQLAQKVCEGSVIT